jgi:hypothetical protein
MCSRSSITCFSFKRKNEPLAQVARAHRGNRSIQHFEQRNTPFVGPELTNSKVANGKLIEPHIFIFVNARDGCNVLRVFVFGGFQIMQNRAGRNNGFVHAINTKTFQRMLVLNC